MVEKYCISCVDKTENPPVRKLYGYDTEKTAKTRASARRKQKDEWKDVKYLGKFDIILFAG